MKRYILSLAVLIVFSFASCKNEAQKESSTGTEQVQKEKAHKGPGCRYRQ